MYIAALRMADEFGCDAIGIQYLPSFRSRGMTSEQCRPPPSRRCYRPAHSLPEPCPSPLQRGG
jgi:hypothetical protein